MKLGSFGYLTYCTNIHPGESFGALLRNVKSHVARVKERVAPDRPFGVGLRLGAAASSELLSAERQEQLRGLLAEHGLFVFTVNGFPYGPFHGVPVKEGVYRPDWREPERVRYSDALAEILTALLPEDLEGSVSTVPGGFKPLCVSARASAAIAMNVARHASRLVELRRSTGKTVVLALEPEPFCMLETVEETIAFFEQHLLSGGALAVLADLAGLDRAGAEKAMRRHVGVCLDACHTAVEFEDPATAVRRLSAAGIRIAKVQLSAGLRIARLDRDALEALREFDEPTYLHQVVERTERGELIRYRDLPDALASVRSFDGPREWRIHFHVPVFLERLERFDNTQAWLVELLAIHRRTPISQHLEVETYTFDVLPERYRGDGVDAAIARELHWVMERLTP